MEGLPAAETKLRLVLDYLPCEPCLAQPVADQELLCTVCARLHRQVAVRVATHTTVLLERPTPEAAAPVLIEPAAAVPQAEPGSPDVAVATPAPLGPPPLAVVFRGDALPDALFAVVVEPYDEAPAPAPAPAPVAAPVPEPVEEELQFDEGFEFVPPSDAFEFVRADPAPAAPRPSPEPSPSRSPPPSEPIPEDDFVFRPPPRDETPATPAPEPEPEPAPTEEIVVEPAQERTLWSPPAEFLPDEAPAPVDDEGPIVESEVVEDDVVEMEPVPEEEPIVEMEPLPDEEPPVEMELLPDEDPAPAPTPSPVPGAGPGPGAGPSTDLYRLRGFDPASEGALARAGIREISHLAGHDAGELAERTGLPLERLLPWTQVANLHAEVGVPIEAAQALVLAGVAGPRGLREMDADTIVDRVQAFGGASVSPGDVKRWKRRA